ncbi:hypothetical protein EKE94_10595 [Mesobaculum littorinae]|uniref:Uncharacterized protein n=1 Tax=Mesobaculum littorinae TaxID=2486419 RepID=A0A438AGS4_9RHOB|nr:hypothetical protein [Mesobaculum littorinae]RVV97913.1 hypothetical protein EKE94_10595 [Mesobaculum littorinae]
MSRKLHKTAVFTTHDLDAAIRMGDHIAIMNDGVIVQTGTPQEIVFTSKDDYVAQFVTGISRTGLMRTANIMSPLDGRPATGKTTRASGRGARPGSTGSGAGHSRPGRKIASRTYRRHRRPARLKGIRSTDLRNIFDTDWVPVGTWV